MKCKTCRKEGAKNSGLPENLWLCEKHLKELNTYLKLSKEEKIERIKKSMRKKGKTRINMKSAKEIFQLSLTEGVTLNLPINPISSQSQNDKKEKFKELISKEIKRRELNRYRKNYKNRYIELTVNFFIIPKHDKDVDNMTKPLLDTIKEEIFSDDKFITDYCVKKIFVNKKDEENIVLNIKTKQTN